MSASVDIKTVTKSKILTLPIQAVTTRDDETDKDSDDKIEVVFVLMEGDTVNMVKVETGIQNDKYIEIISGLKGKEEIIVDPYDAITRKLEQGKKVIKVDKDELFGRKKED
jgi:HlyD family secretion protein